MYFNTAKHKLLEVSLLMFKLSYLNTQIEKVYAFHVLKGQVIYKSVG